jgi:3-hydroxyisobutyrate dehydrogenase-like beta-hydroxyacid dehydrogenase
MNSNKRKVGVAGLGIMGMAMALNARKAGFDVVVTNRSNNKRKEAADAGLRVVSTPRELADACNVIIVMVTDSDAVSAVLTGESGLFSTSVEGKTLIQMSTIDEASTLMFAKLASQNQMKFLDCPVTGSKAQVTQAQLILLAGGDKSVLDENRDLLMSMGKTIVHAGDIGKGTALKLCMNLIVAQMTTALCESVALARAQGLDPRNVFEVIRNSPAINCGYFQIKEKALLEENFAPAFSLANMLKDVRFIDAAAQQRKLALPVTKAVRVFMEDALSQQLGDEDLISVVKILKPA